MERKALIVGGIFGLIAPFVGLIFGLQISILIGNILAFPIIIMVMMTGIPIGKWHPIFMLVALGVSIVTWVCIFGLVAKLIHNKGKP